MPAIEQNSESSIAQPFFIGPLEIDPPILQAPMAGFTNYAFRQIVRKFGGVGLLATEMVNARGFVWLDENEAEHPDRLWGVQEEPRPLAVQIGCNRRSAGNLGQLWPMRWFRVEQNRLKCSGKRGPHVSVLPVGIYNVKTHRTGKCYLTPWRLLLVKNLAFPGVFRWRIAGYTRSDLG